MVLAQTDYRALFEKLPGSFLLLLPDAPRFTIVTASDDYLRATKSERAAVVSKGLLEILPDPAPSGARELLASLERVVVQRKPDAMNTPLLDEHGRVTHIIHRLDAGTGHAEASEPLRAASEQRLRLLIDSIRDYGVFSGIL